MKVGLKTYWRRWGAAALLVLFCLSFVSFAVTLSSSSGFSKQVNLAKTDKSSKQTGQLPFEGKEKENEGKAEDVHETVVGLLYFCSFNRNFFSLPAIGYEAPASCGDVTNLPLYLAKRVLLL